MKRTGSPLITIVKLDKCLDDDYSQEFLKDEYFNTLDTYIVNETGKLEEIIRNSTKSFICFISYTEFINNKFYYNNEKQIARIFIPIRDKDMYEVFMGNNFRENVFIHYNPDIIHQKLITEKQRFVNNLYGFEDVKAQNINSKKDLVVYLNKSKIKKIRDNESKNNFLKKDEKEENQNFKNINDFSTEGSEQTKSIKAFTVKNKKNNLIEFEDINTNPNSLNSTVCNPKAISNPFKANNEVLKKPPLNFKGFYQLNKQNRDNLINLSPENLDNDFNAVMLKTKIEETVIINNFSNNNDDSEKSDSVKLNIFCEDSASELHPNEITNVFNKNYLKVSEQKNRNKPFNSNRFVKTSNENNNGFNVRNSIEIKNNNNVNQQRSLKGDSNRIKIDSLYVQQIKIDNKNQRDQEREEEEIPKEFYDINKSFNEPNDKSNKYESIIHKQKAGNNLTPYKDLTINSNEKIENLISALQNKRGLENLTLSIIRKSDDTREKNFISNFDDQVLITHDNVIHQVIEELDSGVFESNPSSKKSTESERNKAKNSANNNKINNNRNQHEMENDKDHNLYENNNNQIKQKRKYERKNPTNFKSKINEKDRFIEYIIQIDKESYEIKIDANFNDGEYNNLPKKKDGTLDMRRKENKEYLLKLIQQKI